jgi:hypothetical protein
MLSRQLSIDACGMNRGEDRSASGGVRDET